MRFSHFTKLTSVSPAHNQNEGMEDVLNDMALSHLILMFQHFDALEQILTKIKTSKMFVRSVRLVQTIKEPANFEDRLKCCTIKILFKFSDSTLYFINYFLELHLLFMGYLSYHSTELTGFERFLATFHHSEHRAELFIITREPGIWQQQIRWQRIR